MTKANIKRIEDYAAFARLEHERTEWTRENVENAIQYLEYVSANADEAIEVFEEILEEWDNE